MVGQRVGGVKVVGGDLALYKGRKEADIAKEIGGER
jgi:hypothetical protein